MILCGNCGRSFSDLRYFTQHLGGAKNADCEKAFFSRRKQASKGLSRPTGRPVSKRERTINDVEAILKENEEFMKHRKALKTADYSVFDFHDNDNTTPFKGTEQTIHDDNNNDEDEESDNDNAKMPAIDNNAAKAEQEEQPPAKEGEPWNEPEPRESKRRMFKEYVERAKIDHKKIPAELAAAIELMDLMNRSGGSVTLYNEVFKWHMDHLNSPCLVSANKLHDTLIERHNLKDTLPCERTVFLPHSKARVNLTCNDCESQSVDLLTDPRIKKQDWLFFNDDPAASPPEEFVTVSDINSGRAYRRTHELLIKPEPYTKEGRQKVLAPYLIYLDAAALGFYNNHSIEILKFTLGLLNGKCRQKDWAWKNLGHIKKVLKQKNEGIEMIASSGHIDSKRFLKDPTHRAHLTHPLGVNTPDSDADHYTPPADAPNQGNHQPETPTVQAQDLHEMLRILLLSYNDMEKKGGFPWDHQHHNGTLHKLWLVPFIIIVKADGQEHDKLCGLYGPKHGGIKNICRYCTIRTDEVDQPCLEPRPQLKTVEMISDLVRRKDYEALRNLSQHCIMNAFYELRFGLHDKRGIHGACPIEVLHWIQLGMFKYSRSNFFDQTGNGKLARMLEAVCSMSGHLLSRQSDRNLPRTKFSARDIKEGTLMGHEMEGVLLALNLTLRCTKGREAIMNLARGNQKEYFPDERSIREWIRLLEMQLMFFAWLGRNEMKVGHVLRAQTKVKELMSLTKAVGNRAEGMGFKTMNFHGAAHVCTDILNFGVPHNVDTSPNEKGHKRDKKSAKRTQMRTDTMDSNVGTQIAYRNAVDLGVEELAGRPRWDYFRGFDHPDSDDDDPDSAYFDPKLTGAKTKTFCPEGIDERISVAVTTMKGKDKFIYEEQVLIALAEIGDYVADYMKVVWAYSELKVFCPQSNNNTQIYRASPYFEGQPWYDWAIFNLSKPESPTIRRFVLAQIQCFVDLRDLPEDADLRFDSGIYCVIEPASRNTAVDESGRSEFWEPWIKGASSTLGFENTSNKLELANITQIVKPACVVPDIGNPNNRAYLRMIPRSEWAFMFEDWLDMPHRRDYNNVN